MNGQEVVAQVILLGMGATLLIFGLLQWSGHDKGWADPNNPRSISQLFGPRAAMNLLGGSGMCLLFILSLIGHTGLAEEVAKVLLVVVMLIFAFFIYIVLVRPSWANPPWYAAYVEKHRSGTFQAFIPRPKKPKSRK